MSIESVPSDGASAEISCANCVGACCRAGASMVMNATEVSRHRRAMDLKAMARPKDYAQYVPVPMEQLDKAGNRVSVKTMVPVPRNYGFYILLNDCGRLTKENTCDPYESRPQACAKYEVGSSECQAARAAFGLDGHEAEIPLERDEPFKIRIARYEQA